MRWLAVALDALLICMGIYLLVTNGPPHGGDALIIVILFAAPIFSIVALVRLGADSWLGLYFQRRALEERKKIERLGKAE